MMMTLEQTKIKNCWTSLLATDNYIWGIIGLYFSLQKVHTKFPFIPIVTDNVSKETLNLLDEVGIEYRIFPYREFTTEITTDENDEQYHYYNCTINKFYIYSYTDFEKVIFLDGDMIINSNIDFFFHFPDKCCAKYPCDSFSPNVRVRGCYGYLWLVEPNLKMMETIFNDHSNEVDDECILNMYFFWECKMNFNWFPDDIAFFYHDTNKPKYWQIYNLDTIERMKYFIYNNTYYYIINQLNYHHPNISFELGADQDDTTIHLINEGLL